MKLYVTDRGSWGGTKAEMPKLCREDGSPQGGWKAVDVPTDKQNLLLFLNKGWKAPAEEKPRERRKPVLTGNGNYRVYGGVHQKLFISRVRADSPDEAAAAVFESLEAVPTPR